MSFDFISIIGTEIGRLGLTIWFFVYSMKPIKLKLESIGKQVSKIQLEQANMKKDIESLTEKVTDNKDDIKMLKNKVYNMD